MLIRPLRNRVLVKPIRETMTAGGLHIPQDYKAIPSRKAVNRPDHFLAEVVAVGSEVKDEALVPGARVSILTWSERADGTRRSMYTGEDGPDGTLFVRWPEDFGGCVYEVAS